MQAAAATENFDRTDIARPGAPEIGYQFHRQRNRGPVRKLDPQCVFLQAVFDGAGSRLRVRRALSSAGRTSEIVPQLRLYPSSRRT